MILNWVNYKVSLLLIKPGKIWFPIGVPLAVTGPFLKKLQDFFSVHQSCKSVALTNFHSVHPGVTRLATMRWAVNIFPLKMTGNLLIFLIRHNMMKISNS
jgi:hypothetical protein